MNEAIPSAARVQQPLQPKRVGLPMTRPVEWDMSCLTHQEERDFEHQGRMSKYVITAGPARHNGRECADTLFVYISSPESAKLCGADQEGEKHPGFARALNSMYFGDALQNLFWKVCREKGWKNPTFIFWPSSLLIQAIVRAPQAESPLKAIPVEQMTAATRQQLFDTLEPVTLD